MSSSLFFKWYKWLCVSCLGRRVSIAECRCSSGWALSASLLCFCQCDSWPRCIVMSKLHFLLLSCRLCYSQIRRLRAVCWSAQMKGQPIKSTGSTFTFRVCFSIRSKKTGSWHTVKTKRWAHLPCFTQWCMATRANVTGYLPGIFISMILFYFIFLCSIVSANENIEGCLL